MRTSLGILTIGAGIILIFAGVTGQSIADELQAALTGQPSPGLSKTRLGGPPVSKDDGECIDAIMRLIEEEGMDLQTATVQARQRGLC